MPVESRLYRSRTDKVIAGVCGGLGEYIGVDPVLVRLFFVVLAVADGVGLLIYIIMMIAVPERPREAPASAVAREGVPEKADAGALAAAVAHEAVSDEADAEARLRAVGEDLRESAERMADRARAWSGSLETGDATARNSLFLGGSLVLIGLLFLLRNLDILWLDWLRLNTLWPLLLILAGVALLWRNFRGE